MKKVDEHEVFAASVGMPLELDKLRRIAICTGRGTGAYADCERYVVGPLSYIDKKLIKHYRITEALMKSWNREGCLFFVRLFVKNGILIGGHIFKYKKTLDSESLESGGYAVDPTQQEIRIVKRILAWLIKEKMQ